MPHGRMWNSNLVDITTGNVGIFCFTSNENKLGMVANRINFNANINLVKFCQIKNHLASNFL